MTGSSRPGSRRCGMLNQVLDEVDNPGTTRSCGKGNSSDECGAQRQYEDESRQASPAISPEVASAQPEIVVNNHGRPLPHELPIECSHYVLCSENVN